MNGLNTYNPATRVISVTITGPVPVDIKMAPVLKMLFEFAGQYSTMLAQRAVIRESIADALNVSSSTIRFMNATQGSLPGTAFVLIEIEPTSFDCDVDEADLLSYCAQQQHRRLATDVLFAGACSCVGFGMRCFKIMCFCLLLQLH